MLYNKKNTLKGVGILHNKFPRSIVLMVVFSIMLFALSGCLDSAVREVLKKNSALTSYHLKGNF